MFAMELKVLFGAIIFATLASFTECSISGVVPPLLEDQVDLLNGTFGTKFCDLHHNLDTALVSACSYTSIWRLVYGEELSKGVPGGYGAPFRALVLF